MACEVQLHKCELELRMDVAEMVTVNREMPHPDYARLWDSIVVDQSVKDRLMSAEHGQSQRKITELLTEYIPTLVDDRLPTIVLLDEVESMAVARSEASLAANPADVHRATDAVLAALDSSATELRHVTFVA